MGEKRDFRGEKVPTLKEAVMECMHYNLIIYFDVKGHANQAVDALKLLYLEYPRLYNSSIVCSFIPEVVYKMRQSDRNVVTALTHRPWSLSHFGDGKPRFDCFWKHYGYMMMDIILDWSLHNFLWYLCGVSAFLMQKNYISQLGLIFRGAKLTQLPLNQVELRVYRSGAQDVELSTQKLRHENPMSASEDVGFNGLF
ncbi:Glycerophosphodiester phosphodiesterase 1 [Chelonia mydas]|uniref:Glycerophosphodiester phosphodiesterase 1 n=1 Tax=Chelonia mydas TaxID=8469 RepID=M7BHG4_CHEMY|nr:Glycerophosphodiester phosphodiesterase 1 [Chelonia mydas]